MSDFTTILEANCKAPRTRRRKLIEPEELLFLDKVRQVRISLQNGLQTLVVTEVHQDFEDIFKHYSTVMKIYAKNLLSIKTVNKVTAEDLDMNIFEF